MVPLLLLLILITLLLSLMMLARWLGQLPADLGRKALLMTLRGRVNNK